MQLASLDAISASSFGLLFGDLSYPFNQKVDCSKPLPRLFPLFESLLEQFPDPEGEVRVCATLPERRLSLCGLDEKSFLNDGDDDEDLNAFGSALSCSLTVLEPDPPFSAILRSPNEMLSKELLVMYAALLVAQLFKKR